MSPHEKFLELAAAATSGELADDERRKLDEHLAGCSSCRETLQQFKATILTSVPAMAARMHSEDTKADSGWSQARAEARFFEWLDREDRDSGTLRDSTPRSQEGSHRA